MSIELADLRAEDLIRLEFIVPGAPDRDRAFSLEVVAQLPEGSRVWLEGPAVLMTEVRAAARSERASPERAAVGCLANGRRAFGPGVIARGVRHRAALLLYVPPDKRERRGVVEVRQLYEGTEVGRVVFRVRPESERR